jgi:hypothetical protein
MRRIISGLKLTSTVHISSKKSRMPEPDFDSILRLLIDRVTLVPFEEFEPEYSRAMQIMETIDENDSLFLAVGLALGINGIWTGDRHFLKTGSHAGIHYPRPFQFYLKGSGIHRRSGEEAPLPGSNVLLSLAASAPSKAGTHA